MATPLEELVGRMVVRLQSYAPLTALVPATSILRGIPASYTPPYITIEEAYSTRADMQCVDSLTVTVNVHVWTTSAGQITGGGVLQDARAIGWQVIKALHCYDLSMSSGRAVTLANTGERTFYDADNTTGHCVVSLSAVLETS